MNIYGVIMAGGGGTRFWPLSRQASPKQLLNLSGNGLMINETIDRISGIIDKQNIFIVTHEMQSEKMKVAVGSDILPNHILSEPSARNTAACIGYAAMELIKKYGDGMMCIFPADHYIRDTKGFVKVLKEAIQVAGKEDKLVTIGIEPTFPATGYGYINYARSQTPVKKVIEFVEKPDFVTAKEYVSSGRYVWNSGMFVWKASTILKNMNRYLPQVYQCLDEIGNSMGTETEGKTIQEIYPQIPKVSIDYGVLERSNDILVIPGEFGWSDVGSWDTLGFIYTPDGNGNIVKGEQIHLDTKGCILYSEKRLIATIGIKDLIIVETEDAVLVCDRAKAQDVKMIVEKLSERGKWHYIV